MRAVRWHGRNDVRLDDVEVPAPRDSYEVVLAVEACGICGTDLEEVFHGPLSIPVGEKHPLTGASAPITLGHEILGRVVSAGPEAVCAVGMRVVLSPIIACGVCRQCRAGRDQCCAQLGVVGMSADGGLAEYVVVDSRRCVPIGESVPQEVAALVEPYSVAVHAVAQAPALAGARVAVVGVGSVGRCTVDVLRLHEPAEIIAIDLSLEALSQALRVGADRALAPRDCAGLDADVVFETSGAKDGLALAVTAAAAGGTVVAVGLRTGSVDLPVAKLVLSEVRVVGSVGHSSAEFAEAARLVEAGQIAKAVGRPEWWTLDVAAERLLSRAGGSSSQKVLVCP